MVKVVKAKMDEDFATSFSFQDVLSCHLCTNVLLYLRETCAAFFLISQWIGAYDKVKRSRQVVL